MLHYMNCLQGLRFGMNRVLHVPAKKKRRLAAAGLANRSQMEFPACRPSCWVPPTTLGLAGSRPCRPWCFIMLARRAGIESQIYISVIQVLVACVRLLTHRHMIRANGNHAPD